MKTAKIIQLWRQVRGGLSKTIEKFAPEELDYIAIENGYSVRQIILHIAHEEYGEVQYGLTRKIEVFPPEFQEDDHKNMESLITLLAKVHSDTIRFLERLDDTELENEFEAQWGERKPLIDFIFHIIEHETHHRGELSLILGLLGHEGLDA